MQAPRFTTLVQWLDWQESLHPKAIDLGLQRVLTAARRLGLDAPPYATITVGGTNGKGSCVAFLEAILRAAGYRVGAYTSPHLLCYNERIRVNGQAADDADLCRAFNRIDVAREDVSLTYFEFGTLAALDIFRTAGIDVAVLEVGLGGRLDAVNLVDADAAVVTSIGIDHVEWLGPDRDSIGFEKAGIYRTGRPAICADPAPPARLVDHARAIRADFYQSDKDYGYVSCPQGWHWWCGRTRLDNLPLPGLLGAHQLANAAAALMTLTTLSARLPVTVEAMAMGLVNAEIKARFQVIPGPIEWILDVAHNAHAAAVLAQCLQARPCAGRTHAIVGMLADKDAAAIARILDNCVHYWYAATLEGPRGRSGEQLADVLRDAGITAVVGAFPAVALACEAAAREAAVGDRILVFGSFYTITQVLQTELGSGCAHSLRDSGEMKFG